MEDKLFTIKVKKETLDKLKKIKNKQKQKLNRNVSMDEIVKSLLEVNNE